MGEDVLYTCRDDCSTEKKLNVRVIYGRVLPGQMATSLMFIRTNEYLECQPTL